MSEMVEKVARAIRTYAVRMWGAPHLYAVVKSDAWDTPILSGMSDGIAYAEAAKLNARAAVEVMRQPTEGMMRAFRDFGFGDEPAIRDWQIGIDAALKE